MEIEKLFCALMVFHVQIMQMNIYKPIQLV